MSVGGGGGVCCVLVVSEGVLIMSKFIYNVRILSVREVGGL